MMLNARRIDGTEARPGLILLAITDRTELEKARYELEEQREYADKIINSVREGLVVLDWDLRVGHANEPFYRIFKVAPADTEGRLIYEVGNGQWDIPELRQLLEDILPNEGSLDDYEMMHEFESIGFRHMLLNARRLDHLDLIVLAIEDITDREASHRRQRLLASEMSHRVKNILTLVDSISAQTASNVRSLEEFQHTFHGRLKAVARSHGQWLAEESQTIGLYELLLETAECTGVDLQRIDLAGPPVDIQPSQTMALNLTFHELFTNASKYGALSRESGRIELQWSVNNDNLVQLAWQETGGPQIEPPESRGFGLQLIETLCSFELEGKAELIFMPGGLRCEFRFPIA